MRAGLQRVLGRRNDVRSLNMLVETVLGLDARGKMNKPEAAVTDEMVWTKRWVPMRSEPLLSSLWRSFIRAMANIPVALNRPKSGRQSTSLACFQV